MGSVPLRVARCSMVNCWNVFSAGSRAGDPPSRVAMPVLSPGPEASEARFFSEAEVPREHLAFIDTMPSVSQDVFERLRQRQFEVLALTLRPTN